MVSKVLAVALALTSVVTAAPALQARSDDPCQDTYKACIAAGTAEVACSCDLTACLGEDSYRNREYCASATANLAKPTTSSYACNPAHSYPNGATCVSTHGALSLVTPTPSASSTGYACNPAHSYPNGATCISTAGSLALVTPAPSSTGYACNPAHSYPNGATCVSTHGALSLVTPVAKTSSAGYACNPAHSYPNGAQCISTAGSLTLVTPVASSAAASAATATGAAASGSKLVKVDSKTWTIEHLTRYCGEGNTGCDYNFAINANGKTENCTVIRMPGSNAATESWSDQPCTDGSEYKVSWGYVKNPAPAFAVITVNGGKELAWFGVSDVNGQKVTASNPYGSGQYGNLGPEQVYTYN